MATIAADLDLPARPKFSWGAIFAGTLAAIGAWILLYTLGLALGLSSIDPDQPGSVRAAGIGTGIWSIIAVLLALFVGGLVAGREAGAPTRLDALLHGVVMWSLTTLLGLFAVGMVMSALVGGAARVVGGAASATSQSAQQSPQQSGPLQAIGLDAEAALGPINERLRAQGKPAITPAQFQATVQAVTARAVRGDLDREAVVSAVAANTSLSRADAQEVAAQLEQQLQGATAGASRTAAVAAERTGFALWGVFAALLLGLISAVLGAVVAVRRRSREAHVITERRGDEVYVPG